MVVPRSGPTLAPRLARFASLLAAALCACGGEEGPYSAGGQDERAAGGLRLRVMEGNISSGNDQSYEIYGERIFEGLKPDIALVQECNYASNSAADLQTFMTAAFGASYSYYRETGSAYQIPNCVVSRYPIVASGSFTDPAVANRAFAWARIALPDGHDLTAFSLHLLTTSATNRATEAKALVADIQANVPASDYLVIGGDFNTGSRTEACVTDLSQVVDTAAPYPADNAGNSDTSENRSKPHDWLLAGQGLDALATATLVGSSSFAAGLVVDTRVYTPLSEIAPAQEGDSGASGMQHMAVVRDFLLPAATSAPDAGSDAGTPDGGSQDGGADAGGGDAGVGDGGAGDAGPPDAGEDGSGSGEPRQGLFPNDNPRPLQQPR